MSFIINKLKNRVNFIDKNGGSSKKELLTELHDVFSVMEKVGVNNEEDYKDFFYIMSHIPKIAKDIIGKINSEECAKIAQVVYNNRKENPINTINNFYSAVEQAMNETGSITKMAYPQGMDKFFPSPHNLEKWVQTMRGIYALKYKGLNYKQALDKITENWDNMEKKDFEHWLKFYEGGSHLSYKLAEKAEKAEKTYYDFGGSGPVQIGSFPKAQIPMVSPGAAEEEEKPGKDKRKTIKEVIQQIVARLTSAEKLYAFNEDFRRLLGTEHEAWLATLQQLKRKLQTAPIKNIATVEDLVIKYGNKLTYQSKNNTGAIVLGISTIGLPNSGSLRKTAQEAVAPPPVGEGSDNLLPEPEVPNMPAGEDDNDPDAAMDEFMENLGAKPSSEKDKHETDDIVVSEEEYNLHKKAQEVIPEATESVPDPSVKPTLKDGDEALEAALKSVTIQDVILKLEGLTQLYKNRPLARELTIVDLMMDALGISSYFPNLAEATKSALDSNQYVLTRIEDVLAKLRGAAAAESGQLDILKQKLENAEGNEAQRRQQREEANMAPAATAPPVGQEVPAAPESAPQVPAKPINKVPELEAPVEVEAPKQPGVRV